MTQWYCKSAVRFTNFNDKNIAYNDNEYYSFVINASNKKEALAISRDKAKNEFDNDINDGSFKDILIEIIDLYKTTDDARTY